ncbi:SpvB/TcaC N-terminal domain-containing protein [Sorangium sp. So ce136]|uniref:SpvB/TcaC N-terminal domain-containing protein n=1 Tax=Sorangium sp. So ce136 TaxID=3133284 RepID=UPI003F00AD0F
MLNVIGRSKRARTTSFVLIQVLGLAGPIAALAATSSRAPSAAEPSLPLDDALHEIESAKAGSSGAAAPESVARDAATALPDSGDATTVAAVASAQWLNAPANVDPSAAWSLFDGDARTTLSSSSGAPIRVEVRFAEPTWIHQVSGFGRTRGALTITVDGAGGERVLEGVEQRPLELSGALAPLRMPLPVLAERALIEWLPGDESGLAELAFWGARDPVGVLPEAQWADRVTSNGFPGALVFSSDRATARVGEVGKGAQTFEVDVFAEPRSLSRAFLVYELEGVSHWSGVPRSINGAAERASAALPPASAKSGLQVEEINPAWLKQGVNQVAFGAPRSSVVHGSVSSYSVSHVRVIGIPHGGSYAAVSPAELSSIAGRPPSAQATQLGTVAFAEPSAPHTLGFRLTERSDGKLVAIAAGRKERLEIPLRGLSPGWHQWDAVGVFATLDAVRFSFHGGKEKSSPIGDLRVAASALPAQARPELRIAYPLHSECEQGRAYVRGFVHGAGAAVTGVSVDGRALTPAELGGDGAFELSVPEARGGAAWSVQLRATLADGSTVARQVELGPCLDKGALAAAPDGLTPDVGAPYGEWVTPDEAKTLHYAGATLEIPAGAVSKPVRITIRPLTRDQASPPGRGLVNVVPGSGSFRFGPAGLRFKRPVRLTLPFDREGMPPAATMRSISTLYFDVPVGLWRAIPKVADASGGVMVSETDHFTEFMNATLPAPDAPGPQNTLPDAMNGIELGSPSAGVDLIEPPGASPQRTANLGYPLRVPPGRNGLDPDLALTYSSGRGNGWLGIGWDLEISSIQHDTRFGVPDYDGTKIQNEHPGSVAGSVRYALDGAQLTAVGPAAGGTRYERRVEGAFQRILRLPTGEPGIIYWEVTDKNGVKSVYGKTANARLADPNDASRIFKWNLEYAEDRFGNRIVFKYFHDEQTMSGVSMPQVYPKKICYGAIASEDEVGCDGTYNVSFVLDAAETRPDRTIDARAGFPIKTSRRLESVEVAFGDTIIRSYDLRYTLGAFQKTLLEEVGLLGTDGTELYKHDFEYEEPPPAPFAEPEVWGTLKSSSGLRTEFGLSRTKGSSFGGGGGIGVKTPVISASASLGGSSGHSRVRRSLLDVSGDGMLDLLTGPSSSVNTAPRLLPPFDHLSYKSIPGVGENSLGYTSTGGWTAGAGISVLGGALGLGGSLGHTEAEDRHILSDINGDGFVDQVWVSDGAIKVRKGAKDGFGGEETFGAYDESMIAFANADRLENQKSSFFLVDPLARWKAPFAGTVQLGGAIQKGAAGGDGVTVSILKNDALPPIWTRTFAGGDLAPCVPTAGNTCNGSTPLQEAIGVGDDLYFRVSAVDDPRKDLVQWSPEIAYQGISASRVDDREVYGSFVYRTSLADDFRLVGMPKRPWIPNAPGVVSVSGESIKLSTSDDVELSVYKVPSTANTWDAAERVAHTTLAASFEGTYQVTATGVRVDTGDLLYFELKSDSPVDPERVGWAPVVEYTRYSRPDPEAEVYVEEDVLGCGPSEEDPETIVCEIEDDPTPEDPVPVSFIVHQPEVNIAVFMWQAGAPTTPVPAESSTSAGTFMKGVTSHPVCALVQGVNKLFSKACLGPAATGPVALSAPVGITPGEPIYFTLISRSPLTRVGATPGDGQVYWDPSTGGDLAPVNVRWLDPNFGDTDAPAPTHDMMAGGYHRWSFGDYRGDQTFSEAAIQHANVSSDTAPFFFATISRAGMAGGAGPVYSTRGQNSFVGRGLFSPGRTKAGRGFSGSAGIEALRLSDTWSYGLDASAFNVGMGIGAADTTGEVDFLDMNGDNLPDLVTRNGVLFNTGGGFTSKRAVDFDEFREVDQESMRFKASMALGGNDEKDQAVPDTDTRGRTRAVMSTSFSVGLDYAVSSAKTELLDINQDGLPDRVSFSPEGGDPVVRLNTGYGLTAPIAWSNPDWIASGIGLREDVLNAINVMDVETGPNAARYEDTGSLSAGVSVGASFSVGVFGGGGHVGAGYVYSLNRQAVDFIDVNGDGLLDHVSRLPYDPQLRVKLNLGDRFDTEQAWELPPWPSDVEDAFATVGSDILKTFDATKRKQEALTFSSSRDYSATFDAEICYFFVCGSVYGFYNDTAGGSDVAWRDVNGDGLVDHVAKVDGQAEVHVKLNQLGRANLLKAVNRPFDGRFELTYERYGNEVGDEAEPSVDLPGNSYALVSVVSTDGRGQALGQTLDYTAPAGGAARAQTGKYDRVEREDYGSSIVTMTRGVKNSEGNWVDGSGDGSQIETHYFNQDYYRRGLVHQMIERGFTPSGDLVPYTRQTFTYEDPTPGGASVQDKPDPIVGSFFPAETHRTTEWFEGEAAAQKSTAEQRTWSFDHGGLDTLFLSADEGTADDLFYEVEYDTRGFSYSSPSELYLARPDRVVARSGSASGAVLRDRRATYHPTTGALETFSHHITGGGVPGSTATYNDAASTVTIERDEFGNIHKLIDPNDYELTYLHDATGIYRTSITDSFGYTSGSSPNYLFGAVETTTDLNGHGTRYKYDAFGRLIAVWGPNDFVEDPVAQEGVVPTLRAVYGLQPGASAAPFWAIMGHKDVSRNAPTTPPQLHDYVETVTFIDGFDRVIQTKKDLEKDFVDHTEVGMMVSGYIQFDERGRREAQGQPVFSTEAATALVDVSDSDDILTTWEYDALGRVTKLTTPSDEEDIGQNFVETHTTYGFGLDQEGVLRFRTTVTELDNGMTIQHRDVTDRVVEMIERANPADGTPIVTQYRYNPVSDLLEVEDAHGNVTTATFDTLGRMVSLNSPDAGLIEWEYDLVGNLREKQTAKLRASSQRITYQYDYNRLRQVTYPTSTPRVYTYGGPSLAGDENGNVAGRVMTETSEAGERTFRYDRHGNRVQLQATFPRLREPHRGPYRYQVEHQFDSFGRVLRILFPDLRVGTNPDQMPLGDPSREVVSYSYDAGGNLKSILGLNTEINEQHPDESPNTIYLAHIGYDEFGQKVRLIAGNFIETTYQYKPRTRRLANVNADHRDPFLRQQNKPARPFQRLDYTYDEAGNVTELRNDAPFDNQMNGSVLVGNLKHTYQYDALDRLTQAAGVVQARSHERHRYTQAFEYDDIHNITRKTNKSLRQVPDSSPLDGQDGEVDGWRIDHVIPEQTYDANYTYAGPRPHAVTKTSELLHAESQRHDRDYQYDASGNQRTWTFRGATREIIWNEENLASEIKLFNQTRSKNLYDGEGQRAISKHDVVGQEETAYISQDLTIRDGRYLTKHVYAGGTQLASKMDSAWLNHPPTLYFHTDHLRSTQYSSNEEQTLIQHNEYFPSGELWRDETDSRYELARRYTFSGKELDIGTGLHYFGARYYDGRQSQWLSPDPMVAQYFSGQPALGVYAPMNLSLYAYTGNNPTNYVDPNGQWIESAWDALSLGMGVVSLVDNVQKGNWGSAALDAGGVALDALALALPIVPGGAGAALKVARGADKLNDMRKAVDTGADAAKFAAKHGDDVADAGRHMDDVADLGKQADNCVGSMCGASGLCFVAGTEVATSSGLVPIETVSVGDRVLTSDGRSETLVDESWRLVELEMPSPAGARNAIEIRLLRPPSWLAANGVAVGRTVWLAYEEISLAGEALVKRIGPAPRIAVGPGRVVLSTINQTANDIVRLRFSEEGEVIEATSSHRFYSVDRGDWVRADNLQTGEHVRTATGTLAVSGVDVLPGAQRVFNLEVESEHEYFVSELRVLSHNTQPCGGGGAGGGTEARKVNPRALRPTEQLSSKSQAEKMSKHMGGDKGFGPFDPINAVESDGALYIVDGHHRQAAAIKKKLTEVPVSVRSPHSPEEAQDLFRGWTSTLDDKGF